MSKDKTPEGQTWVQKVEGTKKAYNDDNNKAKGKSLADYKPASATPPTNESKVTTPPPKAPKPSFVDRVKSSTPPPKTPPPTKGGPKR